MSYYFSLQLLSLPTIIEPGDGMNKKDMKLIIGCLVVVGICLGIMAFFKGQSNTKEGVVKYNNEIILTFDVSKNDTYEFEGAYGKMHLEVKDEKFRVYDVECPNHNCEQMGWIGKDDLLPIVCLPNEIQIYAISEK